MGDPSIILVCLVFSIYPWVDVGLLWIVLGLMLAGAVIQFFLLCKTRRARWFPLLGAGVMAGMEILYQLNQFGVIHIIRGHGVWNYIGFGVAVLYVLYGTLLGWLAKRGRDKLRSRDRQAP